MRTESLTNINAVASSVYWKHVANRQIDDTSEKMCKSSVLSAEGVAQIAVLHMFGAKSRDLSNYFELPMANCYNIVKRMTYRKLKLPYQTEKKKKRGKMLFVYDEAEVRKFYDSLPEGMKSISKGVLDQKLLVLESKILKQELYT